MASELEEELREACCIGNTEVIMKLVNKGVNINSQNKINGWTSLHWAAKRGHTSVLRLLLKNNADIEIRNFKGETAADIALNKDAIKILQQNLIDGEKTNSREERLSVPRETELNFVPNYLAYPVFPHAQGNSENKPQSNDTHQKPSLKHDRIEDELVLKVRLVNTCDFIEVELDLDELTFENLMNVCCKDLNISKDQVLKVRKLPNTLVRKDKDVKRFGQFQELEIETSSGVQKTSD